MKNSDKVVGILYIVASILYFMATIISFIGNNTGMGVIFLCLGLSNLYLSGVYLNKNKKSK